MKLRLWILVGILFLSIVFAVVTLKNERQKNAFKADLIELSDIKYGLFNVDEWKVMLAEIITKKVEEFDLNDANREKLRVKISGFLTTTIGDLESRYYEEHNHTLFGQLQTGVAKLTGTFTQIKKDIPVFTEQILDFLEDEDNRKAMRGFVINKLDEYADSTFSKTDYSLVNGIVMKYEVADLQSAKVLLTKYISDNSSKNRINKTFMVILALAVILLVLFAKNISQVELSIGLIISFIYLVVGVMLPMIEIDARISSITFTLLGEDIQFIDQVLYYKSKSILAVVQLMISQSRLDLLAVGVLVLTFSVLFPITKLICSALFLHKPDSRKRPFISFMVFKSGKWSMADVMVIAIFMAYIGFDGIISEQLKQIEDIATSLDLLTTNKSNLLFGFFSFTLFVLMSLFTSQKVQSISEKK